MTMFLAIAALIAAATDTTASELVPYGLTLDRDWQPIRGETFTATTTPIGVPLKRAIGESIMETRQLTELRGYTVDGQPDPWFPVRTRVALKICKPGLPYVGPCLFDTDGDGIIDGEAVNSATKKKETAPHTFQPATFNTTVPYGLVTKLTYLGATSDALRLSYREFSGDLARPAFTEDYTIPLGKSFPQAVSVKGRRLMVLGIDSEGLRYRVEAAPRE